MKFPILAALLAAFVIPSVEALAQRDDQFAWGIGGGATFPSGIARDNHTTGAHGTLMFGIGAVDSPFGIRFDGMYSSLGNRSGTSVVTDQGSARIFSLSANGLFRVYGSDTRLYAIGGLGGYWYNPDGPGTTAVNDFGLNAGAGLWLPWFNGFVEARWMNLYRALPDPVTGEKGRRSARIYPVTLGIMF
ncbi:MAG: hypothetical protein ABI681_10650 [Gemmatimonadales bacterium]